MADTARAVFAVEAYEEFIKTQAESALRHVATIHPYDEPGPGETSLRGGTDLVSAELAAEVAARVELAGLEVVEVRISSLAYAPEIAQAMLQRQQASAVIAAREQIVEGAVTMVDQALRRLETDDIVTMDDERRAQMVSNLLVNEILTYFILIIEILFFHCFYKPLRNQRTYSAASRQT